MLLHLEDAKIALSRAIGEHARIAEDFSSIRALVHLEAGTLHPDEHIDVELTGEDLKTVIRKVWRRHWGEIIARTVTEARKKLNFERLDKVLVAGGSSRLPFMRGECVFP